MTVTNVLHSFVHVAGWAHYQSARHARSMPSVAVTASPSSPPISNTLDHRAVAKAPSMTTLPKGRRISAVSDFNDDDEMTTLPDPRSRAMSPALSPNNPSREPDINEEVTALSTKLINAINHQTYLDDTLSATRHELEAAKSRIRELESRNASQREMLSGDVWVRRSTIESNKKAWQAKVDEEKAKRQEMERAKKKIEQELENLTTALFEEANRMVIRAKEEAQAEHDALNRKNDQLKNQLAESESLLMSQQQQLSELKLVVETMASDRDDQTTTNPTAPSSPGITRFDGRDEDGFLSPFVSPTSANVEAIPPANPTSFHHLIQPVLRNDLAAYDDFLALARLSRGLPGSRVSSGSLTAGLSLPSLGLTNSTQSATHASNGSTGSLGVGQATTHSAPQSPNRPASVYSASSPSSTAALTSLKDTKFFKRVLTEDIEPTLRLDAAPGLSWLARRSVINSMTDGSFVVDPLVVHSGNSFLMNITKPQYNTCSLCGESRKEPQYLRNHRFRTSEQDSVQRYPLCGYCLGRVRSTCDFLSFLRMVKDGHWRAEDDDQERAAWEESVRLREQMFWARIGGGVVPCSQAHAAVADTDRCPRPSQEEPVREPVKLQLPHEPSTEQGHGAADVVVSEPEAEEQAVPSADVDSSLPPPTEEKATEEKATEEQQSPVVLPIIEKPSTPPAQTGDETSPPV
ncbi:Rab guanine nucleotide exchange factor SEC2 [Geosmithia morbida]|uniref:Rab guanine nucleotide exchange factor SEC2 n=1 Tax=Geosmithia morbida TaxID=1094350 RepID=A0A9P4YMX0_9HYPO|nr:Rab guanine nucleotide exchange factor SEC2 [Geosmithia morbida]KAF4119901.1 Rab guanine nucleotide exchange factor SEC2 [Geosmithia morbida]